MRGGGGVGGAEAEAGAPLGEWEGRSAAEWRRVLDVETVEFQATISSTNDRAGVLVREGWPVPAVVVAERQSAGRGRRGRRWVSDTPLGLWFTVAWEAGEGVVGALPLRVGLGVAVGLEAVLPELRVKVKWPNDLLVSERKLGGVLCERSGGHVLVGVGLNLNHQSGDFPAALASSATSVRLAAGRSVPRAKVLIAVMDALAGIRTRPRSEIPPRELTALEARSPLAGRRLWIDGIVRHSSERPSTVEGLPVTAGTVLADGSLEVHDDAGRRLRFIAGSICRHTATFGS